MFMTLQRTSMNRLDIKLKDHEHPCDVTLVVKDGKEFHVHRSVLSGASSFFEKLLNSDMKENNEGVIQLEMILESQMADILELIYTGSVQISTQEDAEDLFQLADYLLLPNLKAIAEKYLKEHVNALNCLPIYYLAEKYSRQDLMNICRKFILSNFSSVAESDDFLDLSSQEVKKWISSDEIVIDLEEKVFELVLRWIDHDESRRRVKFPDLFRHVRLTCISRDFLASTVVTNDFVKGDEECLESVFLALQWLDRSTDCDFPRPHPPRRSLERDVIVVTVPSNEPLKFHTNFFLPSTEQWYRLPPTSCKPINVFSHLGKVFVVTNPMARSKCYDPDLNRWFPAPWTKLDSDLAFMKLDHKGLQIRDVLVIKDEICFIVVGMDSLALWRYNVDLNSMTPVFDWVKKVYFCAVVVEKLIYAVGGIMLKDIHPIGNKAIYPRKSLSHSSTFDTEGNEWREIAPLKEPRIDACGVSKNGQMIFIAGGYGLHPGWCWPGWLKSCEVYSIATNEWQFIASLTVPRVCAQMVLIDGTLYVLGGEGEEFCDLYDAVVPVDSYDEERDIWNDITAKPIDRIRLGRMSKSRKFFLKICSLRLFKGVEFNNLYPLQLLPRPEVDRK